MLTAPLSARNCPVMIFLDPPQSGDGKDQYASGRPRERSTLPLDPAHDDKEESCSALHHKHERYGDTGPRVCPQAEGCGDSPYLKWS